MKTVLLAADIYEHGLKGQNQEWESKESVFLLRDSIKNLGYDVVILEVQTEITHFILDFIERKNSKDLIVFNLIEGFHSRNRESYIPALCEYLGVCYTGSDSYAQNISLDKTLTKMIATELNIDTPQGMRITKENVMKHNLSYPIFIKPNSEGSSLGISDDNVIYNESDLKKKSDSLFLTFEVLLIESYIQGSDLTIGVLGYPGRYHITDVSRIDYEGIVYSEETKSKDAMPEILLFDLSEELSIQAKLISLALADRLQILGPARIDFRWNGSNLYFLELNLTPGLSKIYSTLPKLWEHSGKTYDALINEILESALWRYDHSKVYEYGKRKSING